MREAVIQLVTAFVGSLGFALLFGMRRRHLFYASLGGLVSWGIYLGVLELSGNVFFSCLLASMFAMVYSEQMARFRKCPATLFIIIAIIPLVPGSSLYYFMSYAVLGEMETSASYGHQTVIWVLAIAAGISFVTAIHELRSKRNQNPKIS
ncbi:MAG: threonine/serine exporter family protein [Synergistaceae bacterium]|nr:threonine/serine exporter family protein [Synergistaceae bacterium]